MAVVGPHCGRVALREARHGAGYRGAQTRQLDLSRGPRHPDAAGGVEQRTVLAQAQRGPTDEVRGISGGERWTRVEREVLFRRYPLATALHLWRGAGDFA